MANKTTNKKVNTKTEKKEEIISEDAFEAANAVSEKRQIVSKEIDVNQYITVLNGFQGKLVYESKRTGEVFVWDKFGSEQEIELRELRNAKNSDKKFFINNWFMFNEPWVIDYLGVKQFYKNALTIDEFDEVFDLPANEIENRINNLSEGQKRSLAYRAKILIDEEKIDSIKTINSLERILGIELIEK